MEDCAVAQIATVTIIIIESMIRFIVAFMFSFCLLIYIKTI